MNKWYEGGMAMRQMRNLAAVKEVKQTHENVMKFPY